MACFLVPAAEAAIVTVVANVTKSKEKNKEQFTISNNSASDNVETVEETKISFSTKLMWLARLLWGGAFLLAYEHIWHGEVVPWFPFLTAASNPADASEMLSEMATVGVTMAVLVTLVWAGIVLVTNSMAKKVSKTKSTAA
jgi:hypothetical protein